MVVIGTQYETFLVTNPTTEPDIKRLLPFGSFHDTAVITNIPNLFTCLVFMTTDGLYALTGNMLTTKLTEKYNFGDLNNAQAELIPKTNYYYMLGEQQSSLGRIINLNGNATTEFDPLGKVKWINGKLWSFGATGVYKHSSEEAIPFTVKFPVTDFGLLNHKHLRSLYVGGHGGGFSFTVTGDEMDSAVSVTTERVNQSTHKAYGRRDIQGRYIQFELSYVGINKALVNDINLFFIVRGNKEQV